MNQEEIYERLATIDDPMLGDDIVSLGVVTDVNVTPETIRVGVVLHAPHAPDERSIADSIREELSGFDRDVELYLDGMTERRGGPLPGVKNVIAVSSGKGGV